MKKHLPILVAIGGLWMVMGAAYVSSLGAHRWSMTLGLIGVLAMVGGGSIANADAPIK